MLDLLDPDQDQNSVHPDLDLCPNCLQRLLADNKSCHKWGKSEEHIKYTYIFSDKYKTCFLSVNL